mmetsp:Transcript_75944/g.180577  ORF Transcript_75944/g.180577 Transcript_75944/m.180577 type:complete len:407 (+) Transcript_75944:107-1327(+)
MLRPLLLLVPIAAAAASEEVGSMLAARAKLVSMDEAASVKSNALERAVAGKRRSPQADAAQVQVLEMADFGEAVNQTEGETPQNGTDSTPVLELAHTQAPNHTAVPTPVSPHRACGLIWYYHIPKTAGESINWWLYEMKARGQIDDVLLLHNLTHRVNMMEFIDKHIEPVVRAPQGRLVAVHHHDRGPGLYGRSPLFRTLKRRFQAKGCNLYRLTVLRKPMELLQSALVFYDSAEQVPGVAPSMIQGINDTKTRLIKGLETDKIYDNLMTRYILNNRDEMDGPNPQVSGARYPLEIGGVHRDAVTAARDILRQFQFVGFADDSLGVFMQAFARHLHIDEDVELPRIDVYGIDQVNMAANTNRQFLEDADIKALMQHRVRMDQELYRTIRAERGLALQDDYVLAPNN